MSRAVQQVESTDKALANANNTPSRSELRRDRAAAFELAAQFLKLAFVQALAIYCLLNFVLACVYCPGRHCVTDEFRPEELKPVVSRALRKPWSWWLARGFLMNPGADVVVFGSSQMGSAQATADAKYLNRWVDVITHRRISYLEHELSVRNAEGKPALVVSLAMPGAVISDEWLMTAALFTQSTKPRTVVITVAPRDFIDDTLPSPTSTDQFKFFSPFSDLGKLEADAYDDPWLRLDATLRQLPGRVAGTRLQESLKPDKPATTAKAADVLQAVTAVATDPSPEQWVVPPQMPDTWTDNTMEYKHRFRGPNMAHYRHQMAFFTDWLERLRREHIKTIIVAMPSMEMNRALLPQSFWTKFRSDLQGQCRLNKCAWLDLSDSAEFQKSDYLDTVHLNARGAEKLMPALAKQIATFGAETD